LKWFYGFYKISKDFMNFKDSLERNDYNTLFYNILNTDSYFYFFTRMLGKGGREREWEERGREGRAIEERER